MSHRLVWMIAPLALLAACTERPQTLEGSNSKVDASAFEGTNTAAFAVPGWKAGDRGSWEQHLKVRTQRGQNEYGRVN